MYKIIDNISNNFLEPQSDLLPEFLMKEIYLKREIILQL